MDLAPPHRSLQIGLPKRVAFVQPNRCREKTQMRVTRREFTVGMLAAAAATAGMSGLVKAAGGKTVPLLFDSPVSPLWVSGIQIMPTQATDKGSQTLEEISEFDDNKQVHQGKAMIG